MNRIIRDDIDKFFDYGINIPDKTIYIGSVAGEYEGETGVDFRMAERTIKGLHLLDTRSRKKRINIIMNNVGGDEYHGLAIYDAIKNCKSPTSIKVFGHAMSMGSWILQAADKRYLAPNATLLLHYGTMTFEGHAKNLERFTKESVRLNELMENTFLERIREKHPRYSRKELQDLMGYDAFITAKDAVDLGLADRILK